jgi:hypothetical protein
VIVDKLVLGVGQLEELREDSIDSHIFGLPCRLWWLNVAQLIEWRRSRRKRPRCKVAVQIDQVTRGNVAIKVEDIDRV